MNALARTALEALLRQADRNSAGVTSRPPCLTERHLKGYKALKTLAEKEEFEAALKHAQATGALKLSWPVGQRDGFIERVELVDSRLLAGLLDTRVAADVIDAAASRLSGHFRMFPVLEDVIKRWALLKKVRGSGPEDSADWDDACVAIQACRASVSHGLLETMVRDASARIFRNSKRLEGLVSILDVLLTQSIDEEPRQPMEVLQELGLFKEPQPARLAGNVVIRRERVTAVLDTPYTALPAQTVLGLASVPTRVVSVENLTTFSALARAAGSNAELLIYTGGMPSPSWSAMYERLLATLAPGVEVCHWGDVDEGGYRIAAFIANIAQAHGRCLLPLKMRPSEVPPSQRREAPRSVVERMKQHAHEAGWHDLAEEIGKHGFVAEQEG